MAISGITKVASSSGMSLATCQTGIQPAVGNVSSTFAAPTQSKGNAILGSVSKLEMMRRQQATVTEATAERSSLSFGGSPAANPAGNGLASIAAGQACNAAALVQPARDSIKAAPRSRARDAFLGSARIAIRKTPFDQQWARISKGKVSDHQVKTLIGEPAKSSLGVLSEVNAWVNKSVSYVEDRDLWGNPDYWADASTTLALRKGDCEDIAILKMRMLEAAGISQQRMYLTIVRDLVRNADHAVLIVEVQGRFQMLDNATDQVLDASTKNYDYRPLISINPSGRWLHGL